MKANQKLLTIFCLIFLLVQCKKESSEEVQEEVYGDPYEVIQPMHESRLALDYTGRYEGIVPCADCEGIETILTLKDTSNYVLETRYLGKGSQNFDQVEGIYQWSEKNNVIRLNGLTDRPNMFFVGENYLIQLNMMGERVTGELASAYFLNKQFENTSQIEIEKGNAKVSKETPTSIDPELKNTKWRLLEMKGKKVKYSEANNPYTLEFLEAGRIAAFAGCNRMMGGYEQKPVLQIKFSKIASTLMACADMETEAVFKIILEETDNFSLSGNTLTLNKARMAPLGRFEKM